MLMTITQIHLLLLHSELSVFLIMHYVLQMPLKYCYKLKETSTTIIISLNRY